MARIAGWGPGVVLAALLLGACGGSSSSSKDSGASDGATVIAPGQVTGLLVQARADGNLLTWSAPTSGGAPTSYKIYGDSTSIVSATGEPLGTATATTYTDTSAGSLSRESSTVRMPARNYAQRHTRVIHGKEKPIEA